MSWQKICLHKGLLSQSLSPFPLDFCPLMSPSGQKDSGSSQAPSDLPCPTGGGAVIHRMESGPYAAGMESIISFGSDDSAFWLALELECP